MESVLDMARGHAGVYNLHHGCDESSISYGGNIINIIEMISSRLSIVEAYVV